MCGVRSDIGVTERTSTASAPNCIAESAPDPRYCTAAPYASNAGSPVGKGKSKSTILPATSCACARRSSKSFTTSTGAVMPPAGVPMLRPSPSMCSVSRRGEISTALSAPRSHTGTITASVCTFSRPSAFICSTIQSIACSRRAEPLGRLPNVSASSASRSHAELSASAASMSLFCDVRAAASGAGMRCALSGAAASNATSAMALGANVFMAAEAIRRSPRRPATRVPHRCPRA